MNYYDESGKIRPEMWDIMHQSAGIMPKRPGLNLPVITASTPVIKHWRTTKNGKSRLYLIK